MATLLLLHGLTNSRGCWPDAIGRWMAAGHEVVALEAVGHGTARRLTAAELAGNPIDVLYDELAAAARRTAAIHGPLVVVGHSMGGGLAAALAVREPAIVARAVLEEPVWLSDEAWATWNGDPRAAVTEMRAVAAGTVADRRAAIRAEYPDWSDSEVAGRAQAWRECDLALVETGRVKVSEPWEQIAAALRCPTLVLVGTATNTMIDRASIDAVGNPAIAVASIDGAGHSVRRDRPESYHAAVDPFLAGRRSA